jgi:hypothetical protein
LTVFAAEAVSESQGPECQLDEEEFAEGYVCKSCLRLQQKFQNLQTKIKQVEQEISEKLSLAVHHLPINTSTSIQQSPIAGRGTRKRRLATSLHPREENVKSRRLLQSVESMPIVSTSKSPDFAVSSYAIMVTVYYPVADLGFLEGGFCDTLARKARAKNWKPRPFSIVSESNY